MTLLLLAKLLALALAAIIISKSVISYTQRKESLSMTLFWLLTWGSIIALTFSPTLVDKIIGEARIGVGTILGVGLVFVYFVTYRVYTKAERTERHLQELIRKLAINEADDNPPESGS